MGLEARLQTMRIATFLHQGQRHVGLVDAQARTVTPLALSEAEAARGALPLVERAARGEAMPGAAGAAIALDHVQLEAPIPLPRRNVWCVGRNYHAHAKELRETVFKNSNADPQAWPIVFTKVPECVVATGTDVRLPGAAVSSQIDYEAELAIIIGKGGRNISKAEALSHVFGYTIVNDVTARDVQMRHQQWDLGKSFDTFCPMGPWIVTADELDGTDTRVRCRVHGSLRQDARPQHRNKARAMAVLAARLREKERSERAAREAATRKSLIGSGDRSDRIRTYNFPQGRVTDHRINLTLYKLGAVMDGDLDDLVAALHAAQVAEELQALEAGRGA